MDFLANAVWGAFGGAVVQTITNSPLFTKRKHEDEKIEEPCARTGHQLNRVEGNQQQVNGIDVQQRWDS